MREIKFRGKRIDNEKWVYGYYFKTPLTDEATGSKHEDGWYFLSGRERHCISQNSCVYEVIPETVGQYTGLKDKNGKEIYEGDILEFTWEEDSCWGNEGTYKGYVQHNDGGYEVVYINRQECTPTKDGGIHPNSKSDDLQSFIRWTNEINIEVIGNIYENSDLLEAKNERD